MQPRTRAALAPNASLGRPTRDSRGRERQGKSSQEGPGAPVSFPFHFELFVGRDEPQLFECDKNFNRF